MRLLCRGVCEHTQTPPETKLRAKFIGIDGEPARVANGKDKDGKDQFIANALPNEKTMREVEAALARAKWTIAQFPQFAQAKACILPFPKIERLAD